MKKLTQNSVISNVLDKEYKFSLDKKNLAQSTTNKNSKIF